MIGGENSKTTKCHSLLGGASMLALALSCAPDSAFAWAVYNSTCATPAASPVHVWHVNPGAAYRNSAGVAVGAGDTPDAAHGGVATTTGSHIRHVGMADGSAAHPFNSLAGVLSGGKVVHVDGYGYPLLSSIPYDHYGVAVPNGSGGTWNSVGVNGLRKDVDWAPSKAGFVANPDRINPGDEVVLASGSYGNVGLGYPGIATNNVNASGKTAFVTFQPDAGQTPVFSRLWVEEARGFAVNATVKSTGPRLLPLVNIVSGGGRTQDILITGTVETYSSWADAAADFAANGAALAASDNDDYNYIISRRGTPQQAYMYARMRIGVQMTGATADPTTNSCISLVGAAIHFVGTATKVTSSSHVLVASNTIDHFGEDANDFVNSQYLTYANNTHSDPLNMLDGNHPDTYQHGVMSGIIGPLPGITITGNREYERTDPNNPWPNSITFFQNTGPLLSGLTVTDNVAEISNCPGIALGGSTENSLIANNSLVNNGVGAWTCPQSGESAGSRNNTWVNNVTAGRFYQICGNGSKWSNNVQLPRRSDGASYPEAAGVCVGSKVYTEWAAGTINGVTIYTNDAATFAFNSYDPSETGLSTTINLMPVTTGPLFRTGLVTAGVPTVNIVGKTRTPPVNIGAY